MAVPWLYGIGFVIIFSALLTKILRVKLMYDASRRMDQKQVSLADVIPVMATMLFIELVILTTWQAVAPLEWQREVIDDFNGYPTESVGSCRSGTAGLGFFVGLLAFHTVCLFYALVVCFQTKDLSSDFAESSYISLAVAFLFQVLVLTAPILALVQDNSNAFYFVQMAAVFLQNFTVLTLIFIPKMLRMQEKKAADKKSALTPTRGGHPQGPESAPESAPGKESDTSFGAPKPSKASGLSQLSKDSWGGACLSDCETMSIKRRPENSISLPKDSWGAACLSEIETSPHGKAEKSINLPTDSWACMALSEMEQDQTESNNNEREPAALSAIQELADDSDFRCSSEFQTSAASPQSDPLLSSEEILSNWEALGLPNEDFAQRFIDLLRRSTGSDRRKEIAASMGA